MKETPYQYYNRQLGVKVSFLTTNKNPHQDSLKLIPYRTLRYRMNSPNCTEKELRPGNYAGEALVQFSSLCREWKDIISTKYGDPKSETAKSWFAQNYVADQSAYNFFVSHRYGKTNKETLDLSLIEQYTNQASVMNTVLAMKANRKSYLKALGGVKCDIWQSLSNDVNGFDEVDHKLPRTRDGLRYKVNKYAKALKQSKLEAYKSLISKKLKNTNAKKAKAKEQLALIDELLAKHTNLDNTIIASLYNVVAEKMNWPTITAQTVSNRNKAKKVITTAGRNGTKELKNNVLMQVKRRRPSTPMLFWTLDGWDVELLYQDTKSNTKGHNVTTYHNRLTLVLVLDPHNNYPIGYSIGDNESPALIKSALQNAMRHTRELFGHFYMPYQLQSDNYSIKKLAPLYKAVSPNFTPATVGNAKAKVIEPYFGQINRKYCKLLNNWSGHNVDSGSKNQPNQEYLNKIKKQFPTREGCIKQIEAIVAQERSNKQEVFLLNWEKTKDDHKTIMPLENYLMTFGSTTGETNKLRGEGIKITIEGEKHWFDCFDIDFRHKAHQDWNIHYDTSDLSQVLAVSKDGTDRFLLEQKYIQPMALADQTEDDPAELKRIRDFNKRAIEDIIEERSENSQILDEFLTKPELEGTMAKLLLTDSIGRHKDHKSQKQLSTTKAIAKVAEKAAKAELKKQDRTFEDERDAYYAEKVNIKQFIN